MGNVSLSLITIKCSIYDFFRGFGAAAPKTSAPAFGGFGAPAATTQAKPVGFGLPQPQATTAPAPSTFGGFGQVRSYENTELSERE